MPRPPTNLTLFPHDAPPKAKKKKGKKAKVVSAAHKDVELQLQRALGTKVVLVDKGGNGTITVAWHGYDHLEALRAKLGG
jgi:hypothetical protein